MGSVSLQGLRLQFERILSVLLLLLRMRRMRETVQLSKRIKHAFASSSTEKRCVSHLRGGSLSIGSQRRPARRERILQRVPRQRKRQKPNLPIRIIQTGDASFYEQSSTAHVWWLPR